MTAARRAPCLSLSARMQRVVAVVAVAVMSAVSQSCFDEPSTGPSPGFSIELTLPIAAVVRGASGPLVVTVTRDAGFTAAVVLLGGSTADVGVTVSAGTIPAGSTSATLTISVDQTARVGLNAIVVLASAGGDHQTATGAFVTVLLPGAFTLGIIDKDAKVFSGRTFHANISVHRVDYTQPVALTARVALDNGAAPFPGIVATFSPATTIAGSADNVVAVSVDVPANIAQNSYSIAIDGVGAGAPTATTLLNFDVSTPGFILESPGGLSVISIGASGVMTITATRDPGIVGAIDLTGIGVNFVSGALAPGITVTPVSIPAAGTTAVLQYSVASSVPLGAYSVVVTGMLNGIERSTFFGINVVGPPSFSLDVQTAPLSVAAGATAADVVKINRTNFPGAVAITGVVAPLSGSDPPPAIIITANPASTTGDQTVLTVTVASTVLPGTYSATLTATSGSVIETTSFAIVVPAPVGGSGVRIAVTSNPVVGYIHPGGTVQYTGVAKDANGNTASNCPVGFATDQSTIATITANGFATGVAPGTTAVRAFCTDNLPLTAASRLIVADQTFGVTQVTVTPRFVPFPSSATPTTFPFAAAVIQNAAGPLAPVFWSIEPSTGPVSIDQSGNVTVAASTGTNFGGGAKITATAFGQSDIAWVSYGNAGSIKGTVTSTSAQYLGGVTAVATPTTGGGASVTTTVNNEGVFYLVGLAAGSYTVTVRMQGNPVAQTFQNVVVTVQGTTIVNLVPFP